MEKYQKEYATTVRSGCYLRISGKSFSLINETVLDDYLLLYFRDANTNNYLVKNMKLTKRYKKCLEDIDDLPHGYTVINNSPLLESESLRVSTNIFGENEEISNFPMFYPKH